MPVVLPPLTLSSADHEEIRRWLKAHGTPQQVVVRSRIVLAAAEGQPDSRIAEQLDINRKTVTLWRSRYVNEGIDSSS